MPLYLWVEKSRGKSPGFFISLRNTVKRYAVSMALSAYSCNSFTASSRILYFKILPAAFMGKASTKVT
jgi:hypothetical protein